MTTGDLEVSVVIGYRDWGPERLRRSARSILDSFGAVTGELIISDYGSSDPATAAGIAREVGAKHVYTAGDPSWSRSRALNAGFAVAAGELLVSTDSDMLFAPGSIERIARAAQEIGDAALFLQCRDLPPTMGDEHFASNETIDWDALENAARLRPRWGMGGMMAIPARGFDFIRGFDERLHTYGGEDIDFAQRARRAGYRTVWVEDPAVRMYHMWHAPTLRTVELSEDGRGAVEFNRHVARHDESSSRNVTAWRFRPDWAAPIVSVAIATRDRSDLLEASIRSALMQSVSDIEVIVVDDGSLDDSASRVVEKLGDPRVRLVRQERLGIAAARNRALDESRGAYTAVLDDDDLMHPRRLEWQLASIVPGVVGSSGSFVNFDDATGELELIVSRHPTLAQAADRGGAPGHGTWLIRTDVLKTMRYDESLSSGVDNNLFLRMLRSGYRFVHSGKPVLLRRRHARQVTVADEANQSDAAKQALHFFRFGMASGHLRQLAEDAKESPYPSIEDREAFTDSIRPFLPDHLVRRTATVSLADADADLPPFDGTASVHAVQRAGALVSARLTVTDATSEDLVRMSRIGTDLTAVVLPEDDWPELTSGRWLVDAVDDAREALARDGRLAVSRIGSLADAPEDAVIHSTDTGAGRRTISISPVDLTEGIPSPPPWLVIGTTAEEYLS